jgi:hypothetical protein
MRVLHIALLYSLSVGLVLCVIPALAIASGRPPDGIPKLHYFDPVSGAACLVGVLVGFRLLRRGCSWWGLATLGEERSYQASGMGTRSDSPLCRGRFSFIHRLPGLRALAPSEPPEPRPGFFWRADHYPLFGAPVGAGAPQTPRAEGCGDRGAEIPEDIAGTAWRYKFHVPRAGQEGRKLWRKEQNSRWV